MMAIKRKEGEKKLRFRSVGDGWWPHPLHEKERDREARERERKRSRLTKEAIEIPTR
jgi:hypothetical protein